MDPSQEFLNKIPAGGAAIRNRIVNSMHWNTRMACLD